MEADNLVTLILFSYNQEQFIREAVQSALVQTYSPLEIIISDDCSTDSTFSILQEEVSRYHGPAEVILRRNERNLGPALNFNHALEMSRGRFIVGLAGDDIAYPNRAATLYREWKNAKHPVELVCSYYEEINAGGAPTGFVGVETYLPDIRKSATKWKCAATGAACGFSRTLFDKYGPVSPKVIAEDWVYPFRAWVESRDLLVIKQPLIKRRVHDRSLHSVNLRKNICSLPDKEGRRTMRLKSAEDLLGIAEEWLKAWNCGGDKSDARISLQLQKLVKARKLYVDMFGAGPCRAFKLIVNYFLCTGEVIQSLKFFGRFILGFE